MSLRNLIDFGSEHLNHETAFLRLLAIEFAISSYTQDHGSLPSSLDELIPNYQPSELIDPFSTDGSDAGFRPLIDTITRLTIKVLVCSY